MTFKVGSTDIMSTLGISVPSFTTATRPSNPVTGQTIYNTTTGYLEMYDQGIWKPVIYNTSGGPFLYRQIITTSYVAGGYKDGTPWQNVNRMNHSTDICTNLGNLLSMAANYTSGANDLTIAYTWGAEANNNNSNATLTVAFQMYTETTMGTNNNWNLINGKNDSATVFKETQYAYVTGGGGTQVNVFTFATQTMSSGAVAGVTGDSGYSYGTSAFSDENVGYWWGAGGQKVTFASGTTYSVATASGVNVNGQQKGISSKLGRGYLGNEGGYNGGYNFRRYVVSTDSYTLVARPIGNIGEENYDMGQAWQYMMGMYDGVQNNRGWKFTYSTDTGYELGSGSVRTGVPGGSSGHCYWRG
jgi:hypothetical protein